VGELGHLEDLLELPGENLIPVVQIVLGVVIDHVVLLLLGQDGIPPDFLSALCDLLEVLLIHLLLDTTSVNNLLEGLQFVHDSIEGVLELLVPLIF
jgi:hypothetical protein